LSTRSAGASEAFALLAWLSGHDWGASQGSISAASPATTLYRKSQMRNAAAWVDRDTPPESVRQYADSVRNALSRTAHLSVPRIPGHDRYLAALDAAVESAVGGQATAAEALAKAAEVWSQITDELGVDAQRKAYRNSVGLEP
jgi:multiple sugar transport system substrate-binding protein